MELAAGHKLAHYEILEPIGRGGMGEVYRAKDSKLGRDVAIKVLPDGLSKDPERRARFEREAKLLASLNHPAIATLHGFEDGFLVMELVEGETLAERIARGALSVSEAIALFTQVAEGLEAAHEKGVIHRDLKPANIKITLDGKPKILDFGLAKAFAPDDGVSAEASQSPTLTKGTALGTIMGTASYMSPEQARGKPVDKRTDVFAFGCCFYEALTAQRAFDGETVTDIITAVVHKEPAWDRLPSATPWRARELLQRTLRKEPRARVHDVADARLELEECLTSDEVPAAAHSGSLRRVVATSVLSTAVVTGLIVSAFVGRNDIAPEAPSRFTIYLPPGDRLSGGNPRASLTISPDGRTLVYEGVRDGILQLFRRSMDELEPVPIAGTELARHPTISPDGHWVAFFVTGELKKVSLAGGAPVSLGPAPVYWGATWTEDGTIVYGGGSGLVGIPAEEGEVQEFTTPNRTQAFHGYPQLLPDGDSVLFTVWDDRRADAAIQPRRGADTKLLLQGFRAHLTPTGHLIFGRSSTLWAAPFDIDRLETSDEAVPVLDGIQIDGFGFPQFAIGRDGTLAYVPAGQTSSGAIVLVDRSGEVVETLRELSANAYTPRFSPDGRFVLIGIQDPASARYDVWRFDLERGGSTNLTSDDDGEGGTPAWSPDGRRFAYSNIDEIRVRPADGSGVSEHVASQGHTTWVSSWSPDGKWLATSVRNPDTGWDAVAITVDDGSAREIVSSRYNERFPVFSPDGQWVAYESDRSGRNEIYVRAFPQGEEHGVSIEGGNLAVWSKDGKELYYYRGADLMAVDIDTTDGFTAGAPRVLFRADSREMFDVSPDGERFVMVRNDETSQPRINVVLNWFTELERLVPTDD